MRFPRKCSVTHHADFIRIRKTGHAKAGRFVIVSTLADPALPSLRAAFVTSYLQTHAPAFSDPKRYIVTIARPGAAQASNADLEADWLRQCQRLRLMP
jgi:ribonuclease P protein component